MKTINSVVGLFLLIFICSCGHNLRPDEIFNMECDFKLTIHLGGRSSSDSIVTKTIERDSQKITSLKSWIMNNPDGWKRSIGSWATPDISLIGNDFRLLIYEDGALIGFTDKCGKAKQYTKQIGKEEFDFLTKEIYLIGRQEKK